MVKRVWVLTVLALVVVAAGAAAPERVGPPSPRAVVQVADEAVAPQTGEAAALTPQTAAEQADTEPLTLLDCVQQALVNSPDIAASESDIRRALGDRQAADGAVQPPLSFSYSEYWQQQTKIAFGAGPPTKITPGNLRTFSLKSDWVIYAGGALRANQAIARLSQVAAEHTLRATVNTVIGETVNSYLQLLRAMELKQVSDQAVARAQEQVKVATENFNAGAVAKVDVLRAQAALQSTLQSQLQADNGIDLATAQLNSNMARSQLRPLRIAPLPKRLAEEPDLVQSLMMAVLQRPELQAYAKAIEIRKEAERAARAGYYPKLGLNSKVERTMGVGGFGSADNFQFMLTFKWDLWDWGVTTGKVRSASAQYQTERLKLERLLYNVELQVRQTVLRIAEARKRVDAATAEVDAAHQALEIEQLRYQSGEGIYLELLDARTAATQAEANLVTAYYDNALAEADWLAATGGYVADPTQATLPQDLTLPLPQPNTDHGKGYSDLLREFGPKPAAAAGAEQ